ncbi:Yip1-domain-containing protein [Clavulina sp. PMI_390]|nr:Yip1-domain-containing protein [Clavulina sp. PMI_390]
MAAQYQTLEVDDHETGAEPLEFKSFLGTDTGAAPARAISPSGGPSDPSRGYVRSDNTNAPFCTTKSTSTWTPKTVLYRCYSTMIPREDFVSVVLESRPDMYGPFWTLTTVIFSLFVFSSLSASITAWLNAKEWDYDFKQLTVAVGLVYTYGIGIPVGLWAWLRYIGVQEWSVLDAVSIWGYGMTVWIPVSLICIAPFPLVRWISGGIGAGLSLFFLLRNTYPILASAEAKAVRLFVVLIAALHLGVSLSFIIIFFNH